MEKKKLLLVSVSVGLFLVIVIGASILVFSPREYPSVTMVEALPTPSGLPRAVLDGAAETPRPPESQVQLVTGAGSQGTLALEQAAGSQGAPAAAGEIPPRNERNLENIIYITGENAENAVRVERLNDGNTKTIITIPSPRENVVTVAAAPPVQPVEARQADTAPAPKAPKASPSESPKSVKSAAAAKPEKNGGSPAWWVQTNSYSKKAYADNAKKFLESKGITSIVMNGNVGGKTFYRVRVGPYSSQAEADYWLSLIKTIEGMENSLVWKSSSL
jgi:DedD protein